MERGHFERVSLGGIERNKNRNLITPRGTEMD